MKLRTRLTLGMIAILFLTLCLCCGIILYKTYEMREQEVLTYTIEEEKMLLAQFLSTDGEVQGSGERKLSEQTRRTIYRYYFSKLAMIADTNSEFVLQLGNEDIYNNSGIDAGQTIERYGKLTEAEKIKGVSIRSTIIVWDHKYYCLAGIRMTSNEDILSISVVRNITDSMNQVKETGMFCVGIGILLLMFAALGSYAYLKWQLDPLRKLEEETNAIAARYVLEKMNGEEEQKKSGKKEIKNQETKERREPGKYKNEDEIASLSQSFYQMQNVVERYIGTVEQKVEEQKLLVSALSHEMRTPVTAITGYAFALKSARLSEEQQKEAVEFLDRESRRLERLSTKLTQLIALEHKEFDYVEIDPEELQDSIARVLRGKAENQGIRFIISDEVWNSDGKLVPAHAEAVHTGGEETGVSGTGENGIYEEKVLYGDKDLIMVLITNLFDNACKAGATEIELGIRGCVIQVRDNGTGIPEEELPRIMQPFYQTDTSRKQEGFGLGLAHAQPYPRAGGRKYLYNNLTTS